MMMKARWYAHEESERTTENERTREREMLRMKNEK